MNRIIEVISAAGVRAGNDDFVDRLSSRYTVAVLVVFAFVVTFQTYAGKPIICWVPTEFTGSQTKYTNSYCWVRNTYYVPMSEPHLPPQGQPRDNVIPYYQWVPFILMAQAVLFYLPSTVWHGLNHRDGIDCDDILEASHSLTITPDPRDRNRILKLIAQQMHRFFTSRVKRYCGGVKGLGNYLVLLFLTSKLLYMANVVCQICLLNAVFATQFQTFGFDVIRNLRLGEDWTHSPAGVAFPRVTFCDLDIRRLGNIHTYTVQCALPVNMYNEKVFTFIWFWMIWIAVATGLRLVFWLAHCCRPKGRIAFVRRHLAPMTELNESIDRQKLARFVEGYLCQDGVFILGLVAHNTNTITATAITCALWQRYIDYMKELEKTKIPYFSAMETLKESETMIVDPTDFYLTEPYRAYPLLNIEKVARIGTTDA